MYEHGLYTTTTATPANAALLEIPEGFAGQVIANVIGLQTDGTGVVSGQMIATFYKIASLNFGTITDVHKDVSGITGADFTIINDSENIAVEVTGTTDAINWNVQTELFMSNFTTLP